MVPVVVIPVVVPVVVVPDVPVVVPALTSSRFSRFSAALDPPLNVPPVLPVSFDPVDPLTVICAASCSLAFSPAMISPLSAANSATAVGSAAAMLAATPVLIAALRLFNAVVAGEISPARLPCAVIALLIAVCSATALDAVPELSSCWAAAMLFSSCWLKAPALPSAIVSCADVNEGPERFALIELVSPAFALTAASSAAFRFSSACSAVVIAELICSAVPVLIALIRPCSAVVASPSLVVSVPWALFAVLRAAPISAWVRTPEFRSWVARAIVTARRPLTVVALLISAARRARARSALLWDVGVPHPTQKTLCFPSPIPVLTVSL